MCERCVWSFSHEQWGGVPGNLAEETEENDNDEMMIFPPRPYIL